MRVLVLGDHLLTQRLRTILETNGIEVAQQGKLPLTPELIKKNKIDLIIIDNLITAADIICDHLYRLACAPVALMLKEKETDWRTTSYIRVDGFLSQDASDNELLARIKAIIRRKIPVGDRD